MSVRTIATLVNTFKQFQTFEEKGFYKKNARRVMNKSAIVPETILAEGDQCVRRITEGLTIQI